MTIEEYLKSETEYIERMLSEEDDLEASSYLEGKRDAYREILEKLPKLEHEITLWEVVEECLKHENDGGCENCVLLRDNPYRCEVGGMPAGWGFKRIEKKMKEAKQ